jgi:hypothetical protein
LNLKRISNIRPSPRLAKTSSSSFRRQISGARGRRKVRETISQISESSLTLFPHAISPSYAQPIHRK